MARLDAIHLYDAGLRWFTVSRIEVALPLGRDDAIGMRTVY